MDRVRAIHHFKFSSSQIGLAASVPCLVEGSKVGQERKWIIIALGQVN